MHCGIITCLAYGPYKTATEVGCKAGFYAIFSDMSLISGVLCNNRIQWSPRDSFQSDKAIRNFLSWVTYFYVSKKGQCISWNSSYFWNMCSFCWDISPNNFFNQVKQLQEYCAPIKFNNLMKSKNRELGRAAMYTEV